MQYYRKPSLAPPPKNILDECLSAANPSNSNVLIYPRPQETDIDFSQRLDVCHREALAQQIAGKLTEYRMTKPPESLIRWCADHVPRYDRIAISHSFGGTHFMPHVDYKTQVSLNLYLRTGLGVSTWYQPKKEFAHLQKKSLSDLRENEYPSFGQYLYDRLEVIESTIFEENSWYLVKASVPHSVVDIKGSRIFIRVCYDDPKIFDNFNVAQNFMNADLSPKFC